MRIILAVVILLFSQVLAQTAKYTAFTAVFNATAPQWGTGYFTGTCLYDWSAGMMQLSFDNANGYTELYVFNVGRGYDSTVLTGQFTYQYLYKTTNDPNCPCETTALQVAMPAFYNGCQQSTAGATAVSTGAFAPYWSGSISPPADTTYYKGNPQTTTQYFANLDFNVGGQGYFLTGNFFQGIDSTSTQFPAGFNILDVQQRTFTLGNVVDSTPGSLGLKAPTQGCKCGKLLDLVISLDRSGSIQIWQWLLEHSFTQNLTNSFVYGPLQANVGIVDWNAQQWTTLSLTSGTSLSVVQSAVNQMGCCPVNGVIPTASTASCCCCGTPIGGGLWEAGNMLAQSTRSKATKVIILLTDGCQNHLWVPPSTAIDCGCPTEKACQTNTNCTADILKWYNWVITNIPGVKIIAVGVGTSTTICTDQLTEAAGNNPLNVYNPQNWSDLQTIVETITATACTTNDTLCPDCCGICNCGVCYPAQKCFNADACNTGVLDPTSGCCTTTPVTCPAGACQVASCDPKLGCQTATVQCKPAELCISYYCNSTSVVCAAEKIQPPPVGCYNITVPPECVNATDCDDQSACTTDTCVGGKCVHTNVNCPTSDSCTVWTCKRTVGCVNTTKRCDDGNACTTDTCNATSGCQYTPVTCPVSSDFCHKYLCDVNQGCQYVPINYQTDCNMTAGNCTVPACNGTCYQQYICFTPPQIGTENPPVSTVVVVSSALGGAAIAGICVAGALVLAGVGGGAAVAIAGGAGAGGVVMVQSNPVYKNAGTSGTNPLNKNG